MRASDTFQKFKAGPPTRVNIVRIAGVWLPAVFADATNVSFDWPHRSEVEPDEWQQWAGSVDQAPAKVRIGMLRRRKSA